MDKAAAKRCSFWFRQITCRTAVVVCLQFFTLFLYADDNVVQYRRWYVPLEKIESAPFPTGKSVNIKRDTFEYYLRQFARQTESQSIELPHIEKIVLKAKLEGRQLVSGQGTFSLQNRSADLKTIPLGTFSLPINAPVWQDGSEAVVVCAADDTTQLHIPPADDAKAMNELQFRWSLQSKNDFRNEIIFDFTLPLCPSTELQIDLPETMLLTASAGLVLPPQKNENEPATSESVSRTWRVLLGQYDKTTLTITAPQNLQSARQKTAIHQTVVYTVTPQGLDATARVLFDKLNTVLNELTFELEAPLRGIEVWYGDQPAAWSKLPADNNVTKIQVDLSPFAKEEPLELSIKTLAPLRENQSWELPRIRVVSPNVFWVETRCGVNVMPPLQVRNLSCEQGIQVPPRAAFEWADRQLFTFQFFKDDAQVKLDVTHSVPQIAVNSVTQIQWNNNEILAAVILTCSINEGERFTLDFPVTENWVIDSVSTYPPPISTGMSESDPLSSWDVLTSEAPASSEQTLSIQLEHPLRSKKPVSLQLSCRLQNTAKTQFRLTDLSPLLLLRQHGQNRHGESHYIATQLNLTANYVKQSAESTLFNAPHTVTLGNNQIVLAGLVYPLDSRTANIQFDLERMKPNYTAEIFGNMFIDADELFVAYRFRCQPIDSSIDRVFVHFTPFQGENVTNNITWSLVEGSDSVYPLRVRKLSSDDLKALQHIFEPQNRLEHLERGEVWEIRFDELKTVPFELAAVCSVPLSDSLPIPLASLPIASLQKGELTVESPQQIDYRIVNSRLRSVPIAVTPWDQYSSVWGTFRYDPAEELRRSQQTSLLLQKIMPQEKISTAWIWSLRLDSQYEPDGIVRNKALFLVENQGKDVLRIKLPPGINASDVSAVWRDSQQTAWKHEKEEGTIAVTLPVGKRFAAITIEYFYEDTPLTKQRKLRPRYPSADVPILSGNWISWFPPEFDVSLRRSSDNVTENQEDRFPVSKALSYLTTGSTFRSLLWTTWDDMFAGRQRRTEGEAASQCFFEEIVELLKKNQITTWGDLIGSEKVLSNVMFKMSNAKNIVETKLFIDKQAFSFLGIMPTTPIESVRAITAQNIREILFERTGLVLLVAVRTRSNQIKEYTFALTTPLTLSLNRNIRSISLGHCVRIVPVEMFDTSINETKKVIPQNSGFSRLPQWFLPVRWLSETTLSATPWSVSTQIVQHTALTADWNAYELPMNTDQPLYIVHRQKVISLQWIVFLTIVLLTCRKPMSSPIVLSALLLVCEMITRSVAPCYIGIPSGAFLGILVSFGFAMIRSRVNPKESPPPSRFLHHDSTECSASFVQTPLSSHYTMLLILAVILFCAITPSSAQTVSETKKESATISKRKEPYRVFYPTDSQHNVVGNQVWLPLEFFDLLSRNAAAEEIITVPQWNLTKAVYQGSLIRNVLTNQVEPADDFKAVFDVHISSSNARIRLPNLPAVQGRIFWDSKQIQPVWKNDRNNGIELLIENEVPGKHTLEIALQPKAFQRGGGEAFRINFVIPKVFDSTLRLNVPRDLPPVSVTEAKGAVTANTALSPMVIAELGPTNQAAFSWIEDINRSETLNSSVEQFFWIRAKTTQVELKVLFRYRIDGGKIQHLAIQADPRWSRSGPFQCDEYSIVHRTESSTDSAMNVTQIDFSSPVSGAVTLRADFVLRDFNGIGNLRLPEFRALQTRISKSILAVSVDPNVDVECPIEGRGSGFEAGWYGMSAAFSSWSYDETLLGFAGSILGGRRENASEHPKAEYDLTRTPPDWTLNIRNIKSPPTVKLTQSVQLDAETSAVYAVGEFDASSYQFQHCFTAEKPMQIESVEVRDSKNIPIESRWLPNGSEQSLNRYIVFFKSPVSGKYTVTVRGFFVTEMNTEHPPQRVPMLNFNGAETREHSLNLFRTSAVISKIVSPEEQWIKSDVPPSLSEGFAQSIPLGTWRKDKLTDPVINVTKKEDTPPLFTVLPNKPKIKCSTVLALKNTDSDEHWIMTVDTTVNITDGELKTLQFRWDERCGTIMSVEPSISWSIDQSNGQSFFVLSPATPLSGEQHFRITVSPTMQGTNVSIPNVFPVTKNREQLESELFIDLPYQLNTEMIPWDLQLLETVDEQTAALIRQRIPATDRRLLLRATDNDFTAAINHVDSQLTATFYDVGFLVKRDGTAFGIATIDLKNRGQDSFVLQMPKGYDLVQASSAGLMLWRTHLEGENRWKINIGTSDYPQRFSVLFRTTLQGTLKQWSREKIVKTLEIPYLEGVAVQETIWTISFEGNVPALNVTSLRDRQMNKVTIAPPGLLGNEPADLGEHIPLGGAEAAQSLVGLNLIREHNLLRLLNSVSVSAKPEELRRWFSHWKEEWNMTADKIDFQMSHIPLTLQNIKPRLLISPLDSVTKKEELPGFIGSFLETMSGKTREALRVSKEQSVLEKLGSQSFIPSAPAMPILNSQVYWQGRFTEEMVYLFGSAAGQVRAVQLTSLPRESQWAYRLSDYAWLWIGLLLGLPILVLLSVRWVNLMELWLQFPHFWGMGLGILLWTFLPESFVGLSVIVLTFLSFFRPSWVRRSPPGNRKNG